MVRTIYEVRGTRYDCGIFDLQFQIYEVRMGHFQFTISDLRGTNGADFTFLSLLVFVTRKSSFVNLS